MGPPPDSGEHQRICMNTRAQQSGRAEHQHLTALDSLLSFVTPQTTMRSDESFDRPVGNHPYRALQQLSDHLSRHDCEAAASKASSPLRHSAASHG